MIVTDDSERDIGREILGGILEIQRGGGRRFTVEVSCEARHEEESEGYHRKDTDGV